MSFIDNRFFCANMQPQNPYDSIVQQFINRRQSQAGGSSFGGNPADTIQAPVPQQGQIPSAITQVANGGQSGATPNGAGAQVGNGTKLLLSALQALNAFISQAGADPQEITIVRGLITLLSQLISKDQQRAYQMGQAQPATQPTEPQPTQTPASVR